MHLVSQRSSSTWCPSTRRQTAPRKRKVRKHLVPIVPTIELLGKSRQQSCRAAGARGGGNGKGGTKSPPDLDGPRPRPRTTASTNRRRGHRSVAVVDSSLPHPPRRGTLSLGQEEEEAGGVGLSQNSNFYRRPERKSQRNRTGARTAEPPLVAARRSGGGDSSRRFGAGSDRNRNGVTPAGSSDTWPGFLGQIVPSGVEAIAGLPLSGDERDEFATKAMAAAAVVSPSPAGAADRNNRGRRRPSVLLFQSTHDHGGPEQEVFSGATTAAAPSSDVRETPGNVANAYSALAPPLSIAKVAAGGSGARSTAPQQQDSALCSQQWGGFGPGHTPKYFRGKFGVAGERKTLIHRQGGDVDVQDVR